MQREKIENFDIFRGNFPNPNQTIDGRPDPGRVKKF